MELTAAQQVLTRLLQQQKLPQVVLFYGREGMPAEVLLAWLLRHMLCQQGKACGGCPACHALDQDNHDDVLTYNVEQDKFGVAEVSRVQGFLPLLGGSRVAILRAAHLITRQAANKLLKILEDPPPSAYIFLTSTRYRQLLPTVTSRCFHFLLKEQDELQDSKFAVWFEQLLREKGWSERLAILKKLRENKCNLQDFLFFYERHLHYNYLAELERGTKNGHDVAVRRRRIHAIKRREQQQISLNTQLAIESILTAK